MTSSHRLNQTLIPNDIEKDVHTPGGLKKIIESKDARFVIVDVKPNTAYDKGHIPGSINIPLGYVSDIKNLPPKDKFIILYCWGGQTSPAAGKRMLDEGYKYIFAWGGITDWPYKLENSN